MTFPILQHKKKLWQKIFKLLKHALINNTNLYCTMNQGQGKIWFSLNSVVSCDVHICIVCLSVTLVYGYYCRGLETFGQSSSSEEDKICIFGEKNMYFSVKKLDNMYIWYMFHIWMCSSVYYKQFCLLMHFHYSLIISKSLFLNGVF